MKLGARNPSQQVSGTPVPDCRDGRDVSWDPPGRSRGVGVPGRHPRGSGASPCPVAAGAGHPAWHLPAPPACTPCLHHVPPANHGDCPQPGCQELLYSVSVLPSGAGAPAPGMGRAGAAGAGHGASPRTSGSSWRRDGTGWERPQNDSSRCRPPQPGLGCAWKGRTQWSVQDEHPCPLRRGSTLPPLCPPRLNLCSLAPRTVPGCWGHTMPSPAGRVWGWPYPAAGGRTPGRSPAGSTCGWGGSPRPAGTA